MEMKTRSNQRLYLRSIVSNDGFDLLYEARTRRHAITVTTRAQVVLRTPLLAVASVIYFTAADFIGLVSQYPCIWYGGVFEA